MKNFSTTNMATVNLADRQSPAIDRIVQKFTAIVGACIVLGTIPFGNDRAAVAQQCKIYLGRAVEGQKVIVDRCSFIRNDDAGFGITEFTYYLGSEKISTVADCTKGIWYTSDNNGRAVSNRPKSQATRKMLNLICSFWKSHPN
jgi:hypothetical protein